MPAQAINQEPSLFMTSSARANGRGKKRGLEGRQVSIILIAIILIITISGFFAAGMVRTSLRNNDSNNDDSTKSKPSDILEDDTFLLLLASVLPNSLNNILEVGKLLLDRPQGWKKSLLALLLVLLVASIALGIAAPVVYAKASPSDPKRSFDPTILSFAANMISILANIVSVFMVGYAKDRMSQDEDHLQLVNNQQVMERQEFAQYLEENERNWKSLRVRFLGKQRAVPPQLG